MLPRTARDDSCHFILPVVFHGKRKLLGNNWISVFFIHSVNN